MIQSAHSTYTRALKHMYYIFNYETDQTQAGLGIGPIGANEIGIGWTRWVTDSKLVRVMGNNEITIASDSGKEDWSTVLSAIMQITQWSFKMCLFATKSESIHVVTFIVENKTCLFKRPC